MGRRELCGDSTPGRRGASEVEQRAAAVMSTSVRGSCAGRPEARLRARRPSRRRSSLGVRRRLGCGRGVGRRASDSAGSPVRARARRAGSRGRGGLSTQRPGDRRPVPPRPGPRCRRATPARRCPTSETGVAAPPPAVGAAVGRAAAAAGRRLRGRRLSRRDDGRRRPPRRTASRGRRCRRRWPVWTTRAPRSRRRARARPSRQQAPRQRPPGSGDASAVGAASATGVLTDSAVTAAAAVGCGRSDVEQRPGRPEVRWWAWPRTSQASPR